MSVAETTLPPFSIGRVINTIFGVIGRNLVPFLGLSAVAMAPYAVLTTIQEGGGAGGSGYGIGMLISFVLGTILTFLLQAALTYLTLRDLNGERSALSSALGIAVKYAVPLFVIGLLYSVGVALGLILLIIPGLMLMTAWAVCVPVLISENTGITGALSRSQDLTRGYRWPIFALVLIYVVIVLGATALQVFGAMALQSVPFAPFITLLISQTATAVIGAAGAAVIYFELRLLKEGVGPQQLASVFD